VETVSNRKRVLFLTHHLPWPPLSGGRVREAELLKRMTDRFDVEVVAVSKVPGFDAAHIAEAARYGIRALVFPTEPSGVSGCSPLVRRHWSPEARSYLAERVASQEPPILHVEGHYLLNLLPPRARTMTLVVDHNIESSLYRQRAALAAVGPDRTRLLRQADLTERTERSAWDSAAIVVAVSDDDAQVIRTAVPNREVRVIPDGADHLRRRHHVSDSQWERSGLVFVGNFGYQPNQDAARTLVADVFPAVLARCPDTTLAIVGPAPPGWLVDASRRQPRIRVTGWVPDVSEWLASAEVVVCPLMIGGGVKVKMLEALAMGLAVVTTSIGLQGLRYLPEDAVVECKDIDGVIEACITLLKSPARQHTLRARAAEAATRLPTWDQAARSLATIWTTLAVDAQRATFPAGA
jgi:glycosyltransferase involved in cell wall biosynthesis